MNKILPRGGLLDFNLCYVDPEEEKRQILRRLSDATGRIVIESDPAAQIALAVLPSIVQARAGADAAAKTSLLSYATGAALDRLGACVGCVRFDKRPARIRVAFKRDAGPAELLTLPSFRAIWSKDSAIAFEGKNIIIKWAEDATLSEYVDVFCGEDGDQNNGAMRADLSITYSTTGIITGVEVLPSFGGSHGELDEAYAQRIYLANRAISAAGSASYFESVARNVGPEVWDVKAVGLRDGSVDVIVHSPPGATPTPLSDDIRLSNMSVVERVNEAISGLKYMVASVTASPSMIVRAVEISEVKVWLDGRAVRERGEEGAVSSVKSAFDEYVQEVASALDRPYSLAALSERLVRAGAFRVESDPSYLDLGAFSAYGAVDLTHVELAFEGVSEVAW